jgi:DNA-binding transcriptional LysR family regulator
MDWTGVSEFVMVAQTQSFTLAAQKCDMSVVNVSRRVKSLEQRLGVKLLRRTTRKVSLTEIGQQYYEDCKPLVEGLAVAELQVNNIQQRVSGLIKLTAPVTYGERYITPLINRFLTLYPEVEVELLLTNQRLDLLDHGIDMAIRLGHLPDSNQIAKKLSSRQMYVCASPRYIKKYGEPGTLADLNQHDCLLGSTSQWRFQYGGKPRNISVSGRLRCNSGVSLLNAAIDDLGLVQLPDYYVNNALETGQLTEVLKEFRVKEEGIWALYDQNRNLPTKINILITFLAQHLP